VWHSIKHNALQILLECFAILWECFAILWYGSFSRGNLVKLSQKVFYHQTSNAMAN
jgi:hypothetical protein